MKIEDLIIHSYVKLKTGEVVKIEGIDNWNECIQYFNGDAGGCLDYPINDLLPIPLTFDILGKNFEKQSFLIFNALLKPRTYLVPHKVLDPIGYKIEFYAPNNTFHFCRENGEWICDIMYVHELQNILNICKIDKEIVL